LKVLRGKDGMRLKWQHKIRSIQQNLKARGLIEKAPTKGHWKVTPRGKSQLTQSPKGQPKMYFTTAMGVSFWGYGDEVAKLYRNEIDLIITSPPYLLGKDREYGNIGDTLIKGAGYQSLAKERLLIALEDRLGLHLMQKFHWYSPSKPVNNWWTTHAKKHCITATEDFLWLSIDPKSAKASNQNVLVDYSEKWKKHIESAQRKSPVQSNIRPSGNSNNPDSFSKDNCAQLIVGNARACAKRL
jgi:site-specific DNA-methyltransferase (cytosine-N4-specific)